MDRSRWFALKQSDLQLRVTALYPEMLNIYADRGNLHFLEKRCEWRGIGFSLKECSIGDKLDPDATDLIYIGGGQDRDQERCAADLVGSKREAIESAVGSGAALLAVCGGYQLLGRSYRIGETEVLGTGIAPLSTVAGNERLVGAVAIETDLGGPTDGVLVGFENHAGRTRLDDQETALGRVVHGHGNNGLDRTEGYRNGSVIGTYLHGPLLPKNWWFADWLTATAIGCELAELAVLDDSLEVAAHNEARVASGLKALNRATN